MTRAKVEVVVDADEMKREKLPQYMAKQKNTYYVRVPVPKPLWPFYQHRSILRSLQTTDFIKAKTRLAIEVGKIKAEFDKLSNVDPFEAVEGTTQLGKLALQIALEDDPVRKAALVAQQQSMFERLRGQLAELKSGVQEGEELLIVNPKVDLLNDDKLKATVKEADQTFRALAGTDNALAKFKLHELAAMALGGNLSDVAKAQIIDAIPALVPAYLKPYLSLKQSSAVPSARNVTLAQLVERFYAYQREKRRDPETKRNYDVVVAILLDVLGKNTPVRSITRDAIRIVQDVIVHLPPNASRKPEFKGMSYAKIADVVKRRLEAGKDVERLMSRTRNKYLRGIGTIFKFAVTEMMIDANPALDLSVHHDEDQNEDSRELFSADDLSAMFPRSYKLEGLNWIPLVMLYAGLRPAEAAQLDVADIIEIKGVWCFDIDKETKGRTGAERWGDKSIKNKESKRVVPIHQKLIDLGLLDYVRSRAGQFKLFEVRRYGNAGYFSSIRHEFCAWMDAVKVRSELKVPHSFRHTWRTAAFQAISRQDFVKIMGGWSIGKGADVQTYLHTHLIDMAVLKAELDKVQFNVLTAEAQSDRQHDGLIATERKRRAVRTPARKLRPTKRKLVPGKERA